MPCYNPLEAYRSKTVNASGKRSLVFNASQALEGDVPLRLSCGQCIGCRLERSRQWAVRCVHEASLHTYNSFITLTYDESNLPPNGSLIKKDFQEFVKRLRYHASDSSSEFYTALSTTNGRFRYFQCGEYGENFGRPHYHACLFGLSFSDSKHLKDVNGCPYYTSNVLNKIWGKGMCIVGDVTFESAAYVARYCVKKVTGEKAVYYYNDIDYATGEILCERVPEYTTMSRRPGIGADWLKKFRSDVYPSDEVVLRGVSQKPPKYYDRQYEISCPESMELLKEKRSAKGKLRSSDLTTDRLKDRETVCKAKFNLLKRGYEK